VLRLKALRNEFRRSHILLRSAALTYTTLFAVAPLLLLTFIILSNLPVQQASHQSLLSFVSGAFPWVSAEDLTYQLDRLSHQANKLGYVGVLILLATVVLLLRSVELSFNEIYRVKTARSAFRRFLTYTIIAGVSSLLLALRISFHSVVFAFDPIKEVATLIGVDMKYLAPMPFVLSALAFAALYVLVPNTKVPAGYAIVGGTSVAIAFELARRAFGFFISHFSSYNLVYGAFAFVPVFLVWIHLSWVVILSGLLLVKILHVGWTS
jgi:membrane protein